MAKHGGKRHDPARERFWRRTIRRQERSGLPVRDFCRREGLKDWTSRWCRQELSRRDQQAASTHRADQAGPVTEAAPAFLPVRVRYSVSDPEVAARLGLSEERGGEQQR